jgi:RNA polymerase primary sigma factor
MNDAARDVRVFDGAARADRPLPDGGRLPGGPSIRSPLATRIEYIAHPSFDDPGARDSILAEMSGPPPPEVTRRATAPEGPRPEMDGLREVPLLSREQEAHLFRQMNYLKSLAERARAGLDPDRPGRADMEEFERLRAAAVTVKQRIVRANLRLVVAVARRYRGRADELAELVSIGNLALIRAVDKFDFARGHKFSTYATWVIRNDLVRAIRKDGRLRERPALERRAVYMDTVDTRADPGEQRSARDRREEVVARLLGQLDERERRVLVGRFGIGGGREETLRQIGAELGISKERARQIESRALGKLRRYAGEAEFLLTSA